MNRSGKRAKKESQVAGLERILKVFEFQTLREAGREMGIAKSTLSRALNSSEPGLLSGESRRKVVRFLGRQSESEEGLRELMEEVGWEVDEEEWAEGSACLKVGGEAILHDVPYLALDRVVGQEEAVEAARDWLVDGRRGVERVLVVRGVGGVGKTVLAIRVVWESEVQERYGDGIFWVDVERYGGVTSIRHLAMRVGKGGGKRIEDPWRVVKEALRGKRVLVVLDGVEGGLDLTRWSDMLPWWGRLMVTERGRAVKAGRIGVRELGLSGLGGDPARELLTRGVAVDVDERDLAWVVEAVGGLPLALDVGNRVARLDGTLRGIVEDLQDVGLEALALDERGGREVAATLASSYERLDEEEQEMFKGLGVGLLWFEVGVVARVQGWSEGKARRRLRRLVTVGLVDTAGAGAYRMHSLVHRYAAEMGQRDRRWKTWQRRYAKHHLEMGRELDESGDVERLGRYLSEMFHGLFCALTLRDREMVEAYARQLETYVLLDEEAGLDRKGEDGRDGVRLRAARFCQGVGRLERGVELAREARREMERAAGWVEAAVLEGEMLLALGRDGEAAGILADGETWERAAELEEGDDLLLRLWGMSERVRREEGEEAGRRAEAARERWLAGQASPERARLRVLRSVPLSEDRREALGALKERMRLAEGEGERQTWMADALWRGSLLVQQGWMKQAEMELEEIVRREGEMEDARYHPWVRLLEARVAWAQGQEEEGGIAYREAVEELAGLFGERVFWKVDREGVEGTAEERAVAVWGRALREEKALQYVETAGELYPLFLWQRGKWAIEGESEEELYRTVQAGMRPLGVDLPDWDWFVEGDEEGSA